MEKFRTIAEHKCFGGVQKVLSHQSYACSCEMTFGVFLPKASSHSVVPIIWFLSGLTCTHENAMVKSGIQKWASEENLAIIFPDTSPRGEQVPNHDDFDLGQGAGFYIDSNNDPWSKNFKMYSYITEELSELIIGILL